MSILNRRLRRLSQQPNPKQQFAMVRMAFHGDKVDFMEGECVLARQQPGGKWTVMKVRSDGTTIPQMDVMVDVPGEVLIF